jgi:predicted small secreted protein
MKRTLLLVLAAVLMSISLVLIGCQANTAEGIVVTVDANRNADGGHQFTEIDDSTFIIDDIKYTVKDGNLEVSGYDDATFTGVASIISKLNYNGQTFDVVSIASKAFKICSSLTNVYCYAENVPSTSSSTFNNSSISSAILHVPAGSVNAYKATAPWNQFKSIVAIE